MPHLIPRDTSWLQFNARVLQEAADPAVPLYERIKFLAIYSSNLDEFYRVRVSRLRQFKKLSKEERQAYLDFKPKKELKAIQQTVQEQQEQFGEIFQTEILPNLEQEGIHLVHAHEMTPKQRDFATTYFAEHIAERITVFELGVDGGTDAPFLENNHLYLAVDIAEEDDNRLLLLDIPSPPLARFLVLPEGSKAGDYYVCFIDSIIRANLPKHLGVTVAGAYSFKLSRDAEMYIENEFDGDLLKKIEDSLKERDEGLPTRCLFDANMPKEMRKALKNHLRLSKYDLIPGARYHNFMDFFGFPLPPGRDDLKYPDLPPLAHPTLEGSERIMEAMKVQDILLSFPYQRFNYVPDLIREAAENEWVEKIQITLYRVASKSAVVENLLYALEKGKTVEVFVEAKARFDEASNLYWGKELEKAGAYVRYSFPAIKVHTKLLHIVSKQATGDLAHHCYIGTGNFNEKTAKLYCDHALLTCDARLGEDLEKVFNLLKGKLILPNCKHLLVAPFNMKTSFENLINNEIRLAQAGRPAYIRLKMNSLEEPGMISRIKAAANAGVKVELIVRGICRLIPHPEDNITIVSIIDRFLEHARVFVFGNDGDSKVFMGSADWMERNLYRRVEVVTPIYADHLKQTIIDVLDMQWRDNTKGRSIASTDNNRYQTDADGQRGTYRAQIDLYNYFAQLEA